jgi:hypothetical protein
MNVVELFYLLGFTGSALALGWLFGKPFGAIGWVFGIVIGLALWGCVVWCISRRCSKLVAKGKKEEKKCDNK